LNDGLVDDDDLKHYIIEHITNIYLSNIILLTSTTTYQTMVLI